MNTLSTFTVSFRSNLLLDTEITGHSDNYQLVFIITDGIMTEQKDSQSDSRTGGKAVTSSVMVMY